MALRIPRFKPQHAPLIRPGEGVLLVGELASRALHGDLYAQVASQIDGVRNVDTIVEASAPALPIRIHQVTPPCRTASDLPRGAGRAVPDRPLGGERPSPIPPGTAARGSAGSPAFLAMLDASPSPNHPP